MIYGAKTLSSLVRTNEVGKALALGQGNCGFVGTGMFCRGAILERTKQVKNNQSMYYTCTGLLTKWMNIQLSRVKHKFNC